MADERRNGHTTEKRLVQNRQRASGRSGRRASEQWRKRQQRYRVISWILTAVFMVIFYALICACVGNRKLYKKRQCHTKCCTSVICIAVHQSYA